MDYRPTGVCSQLIRVELDGDTIKNVEFIGGCNGNTKGISSLVKGMNVQEAISRMEGITCGYKTTSCPDQLAKALKIAASQQK
ncbi:TIGR03905 family TSCPD domain-containing protein [Faecalicatena contorta]|uniref:TIGR03905 family TSCPD domain-containing protein n=1 Tax=Faecalicatena contorta TaxID=39482 RepID=UPI001F30EA8A|nr:TIGR03905 family TSCPD domain-containing protein [Faecalicatena contorta]MCF2683619.1 TIGR03905 family TSCPD domain-containing protein [Faecalicatena contorta]